MKLLIVDDIGFSRNIVMRLLKERGYTVLGAGSGSEAIQLLQAHKDIVTVITDQEMPGMTGVNLYKCCREILGDATPAFILHTGAGDLHAMKEAKALGFLDILVKPFDVERAIQVLNGVAPQPKPPTPESSTAQPAPPTGTDTVESDADG